MKIIFVYELFMPPFDEGVKKLAKMLYRNLAETNDIKLMRYYRRVPNSINSLLIVPRILLMFLRRRPARLVFIPQASMTFVTLLKVMALQIFIGNALVVLGTQRRVLLEWQKQIVSRWEFKRLFMLSSAMAADMREMNQSAEILNIGIDKKRYRPATNKTSIRHRYGIQADKRVLLHVGHIRESRNLQWLIEIRSEMPDLEILLVGSTSTERDNALCRQLEKAGISILKDYIPDIQEIYQLADYYCFPVQLQDAAMEIPLSVLEAMATNLPILTTRFGRLVEEFSEDSAFRFVDSPQDIVNLLNSDFGDPCMNREKTERFTWQAAADQLIQ